MHVNTIATLPILSLLAFSQSSRVLGHLLASVGLLEIGHSYITFYEIFSASLYNDAGSLLSLLHILLILIQAHTV